jgi:hypothetical protein
MFVVEIGKNGHLYVAGHMVYTFLSDVRLSCSSRLVILAKECSKAETT